MAPVRLPDPCRDCPDGKDRKRKLDRELKYQVDLRHCRQNSLTEDFSRTYSEVSRVACRQSDGALGRSKGVGLVPVVRAFGAGGTGRLDLDAFRACDVADGGLDPAYEGVVVIVHIGGKG